VWNRLTCNLVQEKDAGLGRRVKGGMVKERGASECMRVARVGELERDGELWREEVGWCWRQVQAENQARVVMSNRSLGEVKAVTAS